MSEQVRLPKISVITPSYNQGEFIEETIMSVLGQGYPNLEYIIIDGGSTDNTIDVLRKYANQFAYWVSDKDNGQASAINKGLAMATGDILCWLNSDDMYLPGTLKYISESLNTSRPEVLMGNCIHIKDGTGVVVGSDVVSDHGRHNLLWCNYVLQPSSFWTRKVWEAAGPLDEGLHYALDWDWFVRAKIGNADFKAVEKQLSIYRIHAAHKSSSGGAARAQELGEIYMKYHQDRGGALYELLYGSPVRAMFVRKLLNLPRRYLQRFQGLALAGGREPNAVITQLLSWAGMIGLYTLYPILAFRYKPQEIRDVLRML